MMEASIQYCQRACSWELIFLFNIEIDKGGEGGVKCHTPSGLQAQILSHINCLTIPLVFVFWTVNFKNIDYQLAQAPALT